MTNVPHRSPAQLLAIAEQGLNGAASQSGGLRYATAHLAALRAAAAVLATRPQTSNQVTNVWGLLASADPVFAEWADYFAKSAHKRTAAEPGIPNVVTAREADDLLATTVLFVAVVETSLGVPR